MLRRLLSVAIGFALCFGVSFTAAPVSAEGEKAEGKILYVDTSEAGKTYLTLINPDGSDKKRITPGYSNIVFPKMSETSGWMGFTNKLPNMDSEVYLLSRDGQKIKKILENAALEGFSPDGKFLLYTTCDQNASLYCYSIEDKSTTKISDTLKVTAADWSPKSDWIAVSVLVEDGTNDLYLISTKAQGFKRLTETPGVNESFPVFTKDGKYVAFISDRYEQTNEIEYIDIEKKAFQRPLIKGMYPTLSPTNQWVAYELGPDIGLTRIDGLQTSVINQGRTPFWTK